MPTITAVPRLSAADIIILRLLSGGRIATTRQIGHVLVRHHGYSLRNTAARIGRLRRCGLIASRPIDPWLGRASQLALALTTPGGLWTGPDAQIVRLDRLSSQDLEQACQRTELSIWMREAGWEQLAPAELPDALRAVALARYRGRALTSSDVHELRLIERASLPPLHAVGLRHRTTGEVRIVVNVTAGISLYRQLDAVDGYRLLDPLRMELCGSDPRVTIHDLRHCYAQWTHAAGVPLSQLRHALRHADETSTARYAAQAAKQQAAAKMGGVLESAFDPASLWPDPAPEDEEEHVDGDGSEAVA